MNIADILAAIDSAVTPAKRRMADLARNPLAYAQQALGNVGDNMAQFSQNALRAQEGQDLKRMGSVMGDAPMYWNALSQTANSLMGVAPIGATVWHGSPHKFDKFDSSKIGTGEGAQAYGHGLYFAAHPEVAANYRNPGGARSGTLTPTIDGVPADRIVSNQTVKGPEYLAASSLSRNRSIDHAIDYLQQDAPYDPMAQKAIDWIKQNKSRIDDAPGSSLYKVDLPDEHIAKMLDWDKPLSQQSPEVKAFAEKVLAPQIKASQSVADGWGNLSAPYSLMDEMTGSQFLQHLRDGKATVENIIGGGGPAVSGALRQAGIPGIRYLDGGSRGAGQGTSNYVVFPGNENLLQILERNGQPLK